MRLTPELIRAATAYMNPLKERELSLRGYKVTDIENLGVTQDQYETIDLSDNDLSQLENFPLLARLETLLVNNNRIIRISSKLGQYLPKLTNLILTNNKLTVLSDLDALADIPTLMRVSLIGNAVTKLENYRLYLIHKLPKLKVLDFHKVKPKEREAAKTLYGEYSRKKNKNNNNSSSNSSMNVETKQEANHVQEEKQAVQSTTNNVPTEEQRKAIMSAIENAKSLDEIDRYEKMLAGSIPMELS